MSLSVEYITCPFCREAQYSVLYSHVDRIDTPGTQLVRCTNCGMVYLTPRLKNLYDNYTLSDEYLHRYYLPDQQRRGLLTPDGTRQFQSARVKFQSALGNANRHSAIDKSALGNRKIGTQQSALFNHCRSRSRAWRPERRGMARRSAARA